MEYGSARSASDARHQMVMTSLTSFIEAAKEVRLERSGKAGISPERAQIRSTPAEPSEGAGFLGRITLPEPHFAPIFASVLLMAIVAGWQRAWPPRTRSREIFCYAIKVVIHEPLIAGTAFSEARRARIEATLAARRLEEAEELALRPDSTYGSRKTSPAGFCRMPVDFAKASSHSVKADRLRKRRPSTVNGRQPSWRRRRRSCTSLMSDRI